MRKPLLVLIALVLLLCHGWTQNLFFTVLGEDSVEEYEVTVDNRFETPDAALDESADSSVEPVEAVIDCGRYGSCGVTLRCFLS